jgi:hydroxymethylpyrimidine pyrophosphatase-like HAD family hydrolase
MATLYVTDLDGTLIRDDLSLSDWSRGRLVSLLLEGAPITIATARSIVSLSVILGDIPFRLPVIEFNGAFLTDYRTKRHQVVRSIDRDIVPALHALVVGAGVQPFLAVHDGTRDLLFSKGATNAGQEAYLQERLVFRDGRLREVSTLEQAFAHQVVCFTLIDREETLSALSARISAAFGSRLVCTQYAYRYFPGWFFLSVYDAKATKEQGIRTLIEMHGLQGSDLVVFGDDVNDLGMFRIATRALATANARPELKRIAHEVIGTNGEDSVVRWISGHFQSSRGRPAR